MEFKSYLDSLPQRNVLFDEGTLQERLGCSAIYQLDGYLQALTHPSALGLSFGVRTCKDHYQSLEFVGDSILNTIIGIYVFERYPSQNEGFYSKLKIKLIQTKNLAMYARHLHLEELIQLGPCQEHFRRTSDALLEDIFESIVGAMYYEKGFDETKKWLIGVIEKYTHFESLILLQDNFKDILMRYYKAVHIDEFPRYFDCIPTVNGSFEVAILLPTGRVELQGKRLPLPNLVSLRDVKHHFKVPLKDCVVLGLGKSKKKKQAEQMAAKQALIRLKVPFTF